MELSKFFSHTAMRAIKGQITLLSIFFCETKWPSSAGSCIVEQRPSLQVLVGILYAVQRTMVREF